MEPLISRSSRIVLRRPSTVAGAASRPSYVQLPRFLCPGIHQTQPVAKRAFRLKSTQTRSKAPQSRSQQHTSIAGISSHAADHINYARACVEPLLRSTDQPREADVRNALAAIETATLKVMGVEDGRTADGKPNTSPAAVLLDLDPHVVKATGGQPVPEAVRDLSQLAYRLVKLDHVFISQSVLKTYVHIQSLLSQPSSLPEIFSLFANKPLPSQSKPGAAIEYQKQNPDAIANAIPLGLAKMALDAAIAARDMELALRIVDTAFGTTAFKRSKIFRGALVPGALAGMMPVTAYVIASRMSEYQTFIDPDQFSMFAFGGFMTYFAAVSTLGFVAFTTSNDQMKRVTWTIGTPLRLRWVREDERAAIDTIATAFGFKQTWKWGEEEGADWELLRIWCGLHGMRLDTSALLEGME